MLTAAQKNKIKNLLKKNIDAEEFVSMLDNIIDEIHFDTPIGKVFVKRDTECANIGIKIGIEAENKETGSEHRIHFGNIECFEGTPECPERGIYVYTWEPEDTEYDIREVAYYESDLN